MQRMASSKGKKGLHEIFRHVMRNHQNTLEKTENATMSIGASSKTVSSSSVMPQILSSHKFSNVDSSNTGQGKLSCSNHLLTIRESHCKVQTDDYKKKESYAMKKLLRRSDQKFCGETMFGWWAIMGKEVGVHEYSTLIQICRQRARRRNDVESVLGHIGKAIEYLKEMRKCGFTIEKRTYEPFLKLLVDKGMVEKFQISKDVIRDANPDALGKIGYYEMLLWIQVGDDEKVHELCSTIGDSETSLSILQENYLVALFEKDRSENLQRLFEIMDITKVSSPHLLTKIFGYLGRSLLESIAIKFFRELRKCGKDGGKTVSNLMFSYATCIPNLTADDAVLKHEKLHKELDIKPSSTSYTKLITYLYESNEVATALGVADKMREAGQPLLHTIDLTKIF
ncbi:PREDICTED: pentatricopeptide repeat-containing protein At4g21880, mitochondrial-like [Camelina sativa]|uniref:Pentatricopeptide repeat-containing protein At4g21880, mitochondrial-like n=1 Tax=Camelina sativa TaxID=90675 RepID=A0ABM0V0H5_CAMSA|nr:PREDICTED: pentatricopeptide repeat-containing protein At4g21880, mitochondrial-like [Camelina sativa]